MCVGDRRAPRLCLKALPPRSVGFAARLGAHTRVIVQQEEAARWLLTAVPPGQEPLPPPAEEELGSLLK